jgi:hypothetical protein
MTAAHQTETAARRLKAVLPILFLLSVSAAGQTAALSDEQKEEFLQNAKIVKSRSVGKGVTSTTRVTLSDGTLTHDASVQTIKEAKALFQPDNGPAEPNFKDTWESNVAAWKLAKVLGLQWMTPPSVARRYNGKEASFTWWIDDVMMDEGERVAKKLQAPDQTRWNQLWHVIHVFDQLIYNTDRNAGNVVIDKNWHVWMIDHSRAFRISRDLRNPKILAQVDRTLLEKIKALDEPGLLKELQPYVSRDEVRGLLGRRDSIVKFFDARGPSGLFDLAMPQ